MGRYIVEAALNRDVSITLFNRGNHADVFPDVSTISVYANSGPTGPHDPTDRFTYWVKRIAEGGDVLAPEGPDVDVQWIDARDLGAWIAAMSEAGHSGTFNAVNSAGRDTLGDVLASTIAAWRDRA